jgi:hypothetical protein
MSTHQVPTSSCAKASRTITEAPVRQAYAIGDEFALDPTLDPIMGPGRDRARETAALRLSALHIELRTFKMSALKKRARAEGVGEAALEEAEDAEAPKAVIIELIVEAHPTEHGGAFQYGAGLMMLNKAAHPASLSAPPPHTGSASPGPHPPPHMGGPRLCAASAIPACGGSSPSGGRACSAAHPTQGPRWSEAPGEREGR